MVPVAVQYYCYSVSFLKHCILATENSGLKIQQNLLILTRTLLSDRELVYCLKCRLLPVEDAALKVFLSFNINGNAV